MKTDEQSKRHKSRPVYGEGSWLRQDGRGRIWERYGGPFAIGSDRQNVRREHCKMNSIKTLSVWTVVGAMAVCVEKPGKECTFFHPREPKQLF